MNNDTPKPHTFNFHGHNLRVTEIEGCPWFVAADILKVFGVAKGSRANWLKKLSDTEKGMKPIQTLGGAQSMSVISESGLYKVIMRSDKTDAHEFQDWVTRDVLPAIRKDGAYIMGEEKVATGEMNADELVLKAMQILQGKVGRVTAERDEALNTVAEQAPQIADYEARWDRRDTIGLTQFAVQSGLRQRKFTAALREMNYVFSRGRDCNIPYAKHNDILFVRRDTPQGFPQTLITKQGAEHFRGLIDQGVFDNIRSNAA